MTTRRAPVYLLLVCILLCAYCGRERSVEPGPPAEKSGEGIITFVIGKVEVTGADKKPYEAKLMSRVRENDIIKTGNKSSATVQLPGLGVVRIMEQSTASFKNLLRKDGSTSLYLGYGRVFSKIIKKGAVLYKVETPTITASVRGTEFLTIATKWDSSVWVRKGKVGLAGITKAGVAKKETIVSDDRIGRLRDARWIAVARQSKIQELQLDKLSLHPYVPEVEKKTEKQVKRAYVQVPAQERTIETKIEKIVIEIKEKKEKEELLKLPPLDRLRKEGKPLTRIFTKDGSELVGTVEKLTPTSLILNTGEGEIEIPKNDIRRRVPEQ